MKSYIILFIGMLGMLKVVGQDIEFLKTRYDFGKIEEDGGEVEYTFHVVNNGQSAVNIEDVEAACGCTTPGWTNVPINPGDTGFVTARYDPLNRPGGFEKTLEVRFKGIDGAGSDELSRTLVIEGYVEPSPENIRDELATVIGQVRFRYKSLNMGRITTEKPVMSEFRVYNDGPDTVKWLENDFILPNYIKVNVEPLELYPEALGKITAIYDPILRNDLGFLSDDIVLVTSEQIESEKRLSVITTIQEFFPSMTEEELAQAPKLTFNKSQHDFKEVNQGATVMTSFVLSNVGLQVLKIRKIKTNCGCTVAKLASDTIGPGEELKMDVSFNTSGRKGRQYKTVTIFTNDPMAPTQMVTLKTIVKD